MTTVPERLAQLLETLTPEERQEITAWLLADRTYAGVTPMHWLPGLELRRSGAAPVSTLSVGEESQLVTIRLPSDRHAELRDWCGEHAFTMAAVVRGLIERFLDEQHPKAVKEVV